MKNIILIVVVLFWVFINNIFSQMNNSFIELYNSQFNHFVFKEDVNISLNDLLSNNNKNIFNLTQSDELILHSVKSNELNTKVYKFKQYYKNIKVENSLFYIHTNDKDIPTSANGEIYREINIDTSTYISKSQAIGIATNYSNANRFFWEDSLYENKIKLIKDDSLISYFPRAEPVIIKSNLINNYLLCYKINIYTIEPFDAFYVYVDAKSGEVVLKKQIMKNNNHSRVFENDKDSIKNKNGLKSIMECNIPCNTGTANLKYYNSQYLKTDKIWNFLNCTYRTKNTCTGTYLYVINESGNDYFDNTNNWTNDNDKPGTTALWCLERTHDFFRLPPYNRNSFNDNYSQVKIRAHIKLNYYDCNNHNVYDGQIAYWTGSHIELGDGSKDGLCDKPFTSDLTTLDIIAHEYTHGIVDYEANFVYEKESGALDESFADIFGTMVDFYGKSNYNTGLQPNYTLGEECANDSYIRNMANPNTREQPDTYEGLYWVEPNCVNPSNSNDYCGVHYNSGVQNFWFYLLSEGGEGVNDKGDYYCIKPIGRDKAAYICYKAITEYLTPNSKFIDSRYWTIYSAINLYGNNSNEVAQVTNAWYAVGVGNAFNEIIEINNYTNNSSELLFNNDIAFSNYNLTNNNSCIISSNNKIIMRPNSKASAGSFFHAFISNSSCNANKLIPLAENYNSPEEMLKDFKTENIKTDTVQFNNYDLFSIAAYPNPFNNTTTLEYNVPSNCNINISIYNIYGNKIIESINAYHTKGQYTIDLNLANYSNAVYYCKLKSENESKTIKIIKN